MSSFGSQIRKRLEELRKAGQDEPQIMAEVAEGATVAAVQVAVQNTPPNGSAIAGTNTRSGQMAQHWELDSQTKPVMTGGSAQTSLRNDMQYASYVNDGHRMERHFVPGLVINENSGMLERNPDGKGGIVVGTKTSYVEGLFMTEKAIERWKRAIGYEADKLIKKMSE